MSHNYQNLQVYHRSLDVAVKIVSVVDEVRPFRLAEQIVSSAISIPSNIAEGSERDSDKEFVKFLRYSIGSAAELSTQLTIIQLSNKNIGLDLPSLIQELKEIKAILRTLIKKHSNN